MASEEQYNVGTGASIDDEWRAADKPAAGFDAKALAESMKEAVKAGIEGAAALTRPQVVQIPVPVPVNQPAARPQAEPKPADPVTQAIAEPVAAMVAPHLVALRQAADDAKDAALFYSGAPPDVTAHKERIETLFQQARANGNAQPRMNIWLYLRGGELFDVLADQKAKAAQDEIDRAKSAQVVGSSFRPTTDGTDVRNLTGEALEEFLSGKAF